MLIREVATSADRERFIRLPWIIYRDEPHWVAPLISEVRAFLDPRLNPFFDHATVKLFLAIDDTDAVCGRIAAIINHRHLEQHGDRVGFFGLFECVNRPEVAAALFKAAADFLVAQGLCVMRGPANMSVNDDVGLLLDGFDAPPVLMMPYNPAYYLPLVEAYGFQKAMDLYAYYGDTRTQPVPERIVRGIELCQRRYKFKIRSLDIRRFDAELQNIHTIYTQAWEQNWGAVSMTRREFDHLAKQLKSIVDPELCLLAEVHGEVAGFSLALPDFNQVLRRLNGRLFPLGILKLLWYRRKIDMVRVITMGVIKKFRHMGIDACFYYETWKRATAKGMPRGEMSWILESNVAMNNALQNLGFKVYKRYRLYDLPLPAANAVVSA